jgi:hypothetical protein
MAIMSVVGSDILVQRVAGVGPFRNLSGVTVPLDFKGFPDSRACLEGIELEGLSPSLRTVHRIGTKITEGRQLKLVDPFAQAKLLPQQESPKGKEKSEPDSSFLALMEYNFARTNKTLRVRPVLPRAGNPRHDRAVAQAR